MDVLGQATLSLILKTNMVSYMNQVALPRTNLLDKLQGIRDQHMTMVRLFPTKSIHHQRFHSFQIGKLLVAHALHVGNVGQLAYTETKNGHLSVHNPNRHHFNILHTERLMRFHLMESQQRHARIEVLGETVRHGLTYTYRSLVVGIDVLVAKDAESTKVIQTRYMVVMDVSKQYCI